MAQETVTNGTEALFTREGMPPVKEMIPCALQHVLASFAGIITPAVIMAGVYGFNSQQSTDIIQVALILSAIDTALQAFAPFRRIGGGLPIGAVLMNEKVAEGMGPGTHGSTFGGNPVVCAGANVVVDRLDQSFLAQVSERAVQLRTGLAKLPHVKNISGIGLMVGIEFFDVQAADVLAACREKGLLVLTAKTRLRLLPPLTVSEHEVDMALEVLAEVLGTMEPTAPKEQA